MFRKSSLKRQKKTNTMYEVTDSKDLTKSQNRPESENSRLATTTKPRKQPQIPDILLSQDGC
jgi:hypothetical protein